MKTEYGESKKKKYNRFTHSIIFVLIFAIMITYCCLNIKIDYVSAFTAIGDGLSGDVEMKDALQDAYIYAFGDSVNNEKFEG